MIPNIFHFVFGMRPDFGGKPFSLIHYLSIKSAMGINNPVKIYFHYQYEPHGECWDAIKPYLTLVPIIAPVDIFGNPLLHVAHQADIVRLYARKDYGGVYLDLDTISVKPLLPLFNNDFVIGQELDPGYHYRPLKSKLDNFRYKIFNRNKRIKKIRGLCNAVMLSKPNSDFVNIWIESYRDFRSKGRDEFWSEHSVDKPRELAKAHPHLVSVQNPHAFHFPLYADKGLKLLFEGNRSFPEAYVHHLWETFSWDKYLKNLTSKDIQTIDTTYNIIARRFI